MSQKKKREGTSWKRGYEMSENKEALKAIIIPE